YARGGTTGRILCSPGPPRSEPAEQGRRDVAFGSRGRQGDPASPPRLLRSPSSSPEGPTRRPSGCSGLPRSFAVSAVHALQRPEGVPPRPLQRRVGQRSVVPAAERVQPRD
ncbi:hypothetical protein THAOC_14941, partial [Thalassiosira oceanica]